MRKGSPAEEIRHRSKRREEKSVCHQERKEKESNNLGPWVNVGEEPRYLNGFLDPNVPPVGVGLSQ